MEPKFFNGLEVVKSYIFTKGIRQKKIHKSKRINKKWRKQYGYIAIPDKQVYVIDNKIYGHPITINKMLKLVKGREKNESN